jgi:hypothetical protein
MNGQRETQEKKAHLPEHNLLRSWLPLTVGPDVIYEGEREQHLEAVRPSHACISQRQGPDPSLSINEPVSMI